MNLFLDKKMIMDFYIITINIYDVLLCYRSEEPALTNMDISTGHMVLVSVPLYIFKTIKIY